MHYLVGDIGNTLIKVSLLNEKFKIIYSNSIKTHSIKNKNNLSKFFKKILKKNIHKKILFSSVDPKNFKILNNFLIKKKFKIFELKKFNIKKLIKINVKNINQVGSDRIANAIGSFYTYKGNSIVIDFGTATTFDIVRSPGVYDGGVIAPGVESSINNLKNQTALLPLIKLKNRINNYGKDTTQAMNAGFLWGYQGLIDNIIKQISSKSKKKYRIVLTGGYSEIFKKLIHQKTIINKNITIEGIIQIYKLFLK